MGTCVLGAASIGQMWSAQTVQSTTRPGPIAVLEPHLAAYGLGFSLLDDRGRKVASHTGGLPGYVSRVTLVPEERLGVVVGEDAVEAVDDLAIACTKGVVVQSTIYDGCGVRYRGDPQNYR